MRKRREVSSVFRFKSPVDNLLYNILLQALRDNDIEYLKRGDGCEIWHYLKNQKYNIIVSHETMLKGSENECLYSAL